MPALACRFLYRFRRLRCHRLSCRRFGQRIFSSPVSLPQGAGLRAGFAAFCGLRACTAAAFFAGLGLSSCRFLLGGRRRFAFRIRHFVHLSCSAVACYSSSHPQQQPLAKRSRFAPVHASLLIQSHVGVRVHCDATPCGSRNCCAPLHHERRDLVDSLLARLILASARHLQAPAESAAGRTLPFRAELRRTMRASRIARFGRHARRHSGLCRLARCQPLCRGRIRCRAGHTLHPAPQADAPHPDTHA